ncbi:MOSC domain-containing protein [Zoogloea sp.]|uniref:MOSC domain-containing protein n=1 Tax=Zoogloea sp. TaxID=49181 RepID=UPI0026170A64|nr:MOSC domain-containing protein [Zoogloea sp.]MDD3352574.1 MOSC domain-containing protein [Zoogloea sp.]
MSAHTLRLSALYRYPVKSMRGQSLERSHLTPLGLAFDRMWMVADRHGRLVTGREFPELVKVTAEPSDLGVTLAAQGRAPLFVPNTAFSVPQDATVWSDTFPAWGGAVEADAWISRFAGVSLRFLWAGAQPTRRLQTDPEVPLSFADGYPLLLTGQSSLEDLESRVGRALGMARFRPNLVVSGAEAFAEDHWKRIRIGDATFRIVKPCERCVFTTVDPDAGSKGLDQEPLRTLAKYRRTPAGVIFGQNVIAEGSAELRPGMEVEILA